MLGHVRICNSKKGKNDKLGYVKFMKFYQKALLRKWKYNLRRDIFVIYIWKRTCITCVYILYIYMYICIHMYLYTHIYVTFINQ